MKIRSGQIWEKNNTGALVIVRKGSSKDKVTFTHINSIKGHSLVKFLFFKYYSYTGDCLIGKQLKKNREQYET